MPDKNPARILYVEDEEDIQTVARIALENVGGFDVKICSSGREALEAVAEFNPDCIILDVMMPGMDGPATLTALRALPFAVHIPVIFMTAKIQPSEVKHYKELGSLGVISKPFDPMTLAARVKELCAWQ